MSAQPAPPRDRYNERDKERPIIVHCVGLMIQAKTGCNERKAIEAAWDIFDYFGQPKTLSGVS